MVVIGKFIMMIMIGCFRLKYYISYFTLCNYLCTIKKRDDFQSLNFNLKYNHKEN